MTRFIRILLASCTCLLVCLVCLAKAEDAPAGKYFSLKDHKVFYVEAGQGAPMIFLHNGGSSHRIWDQQLAHFGKKYHVYAMDNLGFGRSDKPDIDYPLDLHVAQLAAFIEHIGAPQVTLVGHCMGGSMALNYAASNPQRVTRLVLCNVYTEQTLLSGLLADTYRAFAADPAKLKVADEAAKMAPPFGKQYSDEPMARVALARVIARADTYAISDRVSLPANMPPMLLIWGAQNPVLTLEAGKTLRDRLKPTAFAPLPACQHMAMLEDPSAFNAAIESFLAK